MSGAKKPSLPITRQLFATHDPKQCVNDYLASEEAERELAGELHGRVPGHYGHNVRACLVKDEYHAEARSILRALRGQS